MENVECICFRNLVIESSCANLKSGLNPLIAGIPDEKKIMLQTISGNEKKGNSFATKVGIFPAEYIDSIKNVFEIMVNNI